MPRLKLQPQWVNALETSAMIVGTMALIAVIDWVLPVDLRIFGIIPRTLRGLAGIAFAPLLHLGFAHLSANALPLFVLLTLLFGQRHYRPGRTLGWLWVGSGVGTWLIGRGGAIHIGASALIYGLVVYLVAAGLVVAELASGARVGSSPASLWWNILWRRAATRYDFVGRPPGRSDSGLAGGPFSPRLTSSCGGGQGVWQP